MFIYYIYIYKEIILDFFQLKDRSHSKTTDVECIQFHNNIYIYSPMRFLFLLFVIFLNINILNIYSSLRVIKQHLENGTGKLFLIKLLKINLIVTLYT